MNELRERDMTAVLYLNNSWEWSGGYSVYLQWSGHGDAVVPAVDGWPAYMEYVKQFPQSDSAKALFANHVNYIVSRTNRYNQIKYVDDPTIMSWQIGNEPRAFSDENKEPFARWMADVAAQIKSLDPNHMVSSGSELVGMRNGYESFREDSCRPQHQLSEYPHLALQLELGEGGQPEGTSSACQGKY